MTPATGPGPWFAIQVAWRREFQTSRLLVLKGYQPFLPTAFKSCGHAKDQPLFPGYLFCRMDPFAPGKIVTTPGVKRILGAGRRPLPIEEQVIADIQFIVNSGAAYDSWPAPPDGPKMRIIRGPLSGLSGTIVESQNRPRVVVAITALARAVAVQTEWDWLAGSEIDCEIVRAASPVAFA